MAFTYFFRDLPILELVTQHVVPYVSGRSRVTVWDAGCAMGPEPYTLAILFAEAMGKFAFKNLRIVATDLDASFGAVIRAGVYADEEIARVPDEIRRKYFRKAERPGSCEVAPEIRERVTFIHHDLLTLAPVGQGLSLIVCKNVLLHFQPGERVEVLRMFHGALAPGGYFASEQTQKMPTEVGHLFAQVTGDGQLHRKVGE